MVLHVMQRGLNRELPVSQMTFTETFDAIVVGLGASGARALIALAARGLHVLGMDEQTSVVGGAVRPTVSSTEGQSEGSKTVCALEKEYARTLRATSDVTLPLALETAALHYGAEIRYNCTVAGVFSEKEGDIYRVTGLRVFTDAGLTDIYTRAVIDATEDASVCRLCGCDLLPGREFDGAFRPFSQEYLTTDGKGGLQHRTHDSGRLLSTDIPTFSRELQQLQAELPAGDREERILCASRVPDMREAIRIAGNEVLTGKALLDVDGAVREPLFYTYPGTDGHTKDTAFEDDLVNALQVMTGPRGARISIGIPAGAMIPRGYDGLLAAGRSISVDHDMASCIHDRRDLEILGEIAGELVYLAIDGDTALSDVPYSLLLKTLEERGCIGDGDRAPDAVRLPETDAEILAELATDTPFAAIWQVYRHLLDPAYLAPLSVGLSSADKRLRYHTAVALGLAKDERAVPVLCEIAEKRDCTRPDGVGFPLCLSAIWLLGRFRCQAAVPYLLSLLRDGGSFDGETFVSCDFFRSAEEVSAQLCAYAAVALKKIAAESGDTALTEQTEALVRSSEMKLTVSMRESERDFDMKPELLLYLSR